MKAKNIFTVCFLCASFLFMGCVEDSIDVAKPTVIITGIYELYTGDELGTLTLSGKTVYNGKRVEGTLAWKDASITYQEASEQQAEWVFTPADKSLYAVVEGKIEVIIMSKDPIHIEPMVIITGIYELHTGDKLGTLALIGRVEYNGRHVEGTLEWKDASKTYQEVGEQQVEWIFTPADKFLYAVMEGKITITVVPSIYVCGVQVNKDGKAVSKIWKNGYLLYTLTDKTYDAGIGNMVFSNGHLYTCGYEKNESQIKVAKIWKDGTLLYTLTNGTYDAGIGNMIFANGHLYTCGYEKNKDGIEVAKIWRDGRLYYTLTDGTLWAVACSITISNGHLYTCGYQINERRIENAKIWKDNELLYWLTDGTKPTYAYSLMIVDDMLYTAGKEYYHGNYVAKVWKNNRVLYTTDENLNTEAFDITISNDHIYQCVGERSKQSGGETTLKILKDGKLLYKLTDGSHYAHAYSLVVSGGDVYTCGVENVNNVPTGKVWKNDTLLYSTKGVTYMGILVNNR